MGNKNYDDLVFKDLNYDSYLKIPELLQLQKEISSPAHHDEMFFIVIHQATELWFKLLLHESQLLREAFAEVSVSRALKNLKRMTAIMDLLIKQINLLSTLTPVEFAGFRDHLRPASGFQSSQFRLLEFTFGLREDFFINFFSKVPEAAAKLKKAQGEPSIYDDFVHSLAKAGYAVPVTLLKRDVHLVWEVDEELTTTIKGIYENPGDNYHWVLLFEGMLDFDEKFSLWRATHILMVARTIGHKQGTGGSAGIKFLQSRADLKLFPELWHLRSQVGGSY